MGVFPSCQESWNETVLNHLELFYLLHFPFFSAFPEFFRDYLITTFSCEHQNSMKRKLIAKVPIADAIRVFLHSCPFFILPAPCTSVLSHVLEPMFLLSSLPTHTNANIIQPAGFCWALIPMGILRRRKSGVWDGIRNFKGATPKHALLAKAQHTQGSRRLSGRSLTT